MCTSSSSWIVERVVNRSAPPFRSIWVSFSFPFGLRCLVMFLLADLAMFVSLPCTTVARVSSCSLCSATSITNSCHNFLELPTCLWSCGWRMCVTLASARLNQRLRRKRVRLLNHWRRGRRKSPTRLQRQRITLRWPSNSFPMKSYSALFIFSLRITWLGCRLQVRDTSPSLVPCLAFV